MKIRIEAVLEFDYDVSDYVLRTSDREGLLKKILITELSKSDVESRFKIKLKDRDKYWKLQFTDFVSGKPDKSGNYVIKNRYGMIGTDDYTTSGGGHWWNNKDDVMYSPSSFRELGSY